MAGWLDAGEVKSDANAAREDVRRYMPRDLMGRAGLEGLAEFHRPGGFARCLGPPVRRVDQTQSR